MKAVFVKSLFFTAIILMSSMVYGANLKWRVGNTNLPFCQITQPYDLLIAKDQGGGKVDLAPGGGTLPKGEYVIFVRGMTKNIALNVKRSGKYRWERKDLHYVEFYHYNHQTKKFRHLYAGIKEKPTKSYQWEGPLATYREGRRRCFYFIPHHIINEVADDVLKNKGYIQYTGEKKIAARDVGYYFRTFDEQGRRTRHEISVGEEFGHIFDYAGYMFVHTKNNYFGWSRRVRSLTPEHWQRNVASIEKRSDAMVRKWIVGIVTYVGAALIIMLVPFMRVFSEGIADKTLGFLRYFWWLWLLSGYSLYVFFRSAMEDQWEHGADPSSMPIVLTGFLGFPFIALMPFVVYVIILMMQLRSVTKKSEKLAKRAMSEDLSRDADYDAVREYINKGSDGKHHKPSVVEKKRMQSLTDELRKRKEAYESFIEAARVREHAREWRDRDE